MADVRKVLGQIAPTVNVETALYTATHNASVNLLITNRGKSDAMVTIRVAIADAAADNKQYVTKKIKVPANDFISIDKLDIAATDVIYCTAASPNITFQAFGKESTTN
jgi:hypothetical protein